MVPVGRITARRRVTRVRRDAEPTQRADTLAVEEPLEIRVGGRTLAGTMRTPGHDFELVAGYLVSEGVVTTGADYSTARYCAGTDAQGANTYNVIDATLAPHVPPPGSELVRANPVTSACGICGKDSIAAVHTASVHDPAADTMTVAAGTSPTGCAPNRASSTRPVACTPPRCSTRMVAFSPSGRTSAGTTPWTR